MRKLIGALSLFTALAGCTEDPVAPFVPCDAFLASFTAATGDTVQASLGVRYIDVEVGTGPAVQQGNFAYVNYSGYKMSGEGFDTSCDDAETPSVLIGAGGLIPGFEAGLIGMRHQGVRRIFIPSAQAYPAGTVFFDGTPHPLAGLDLIFDIQLATQL